MIRVSCALFLALTLPAAAEIDTPQGCAKIPYGDTRLECYDKLFRKDETPDERISKANQDWKKNWTIETSVSKLDDSTNVTVWTLSDILRRDRYGGEHVVRLLITCRENTTSLIIYFEGGYIRGYRDRLPVTYRIDKQQATKISMTESSEGEALGLWNGGSAIPFIRKLFGANRLLTEVTPIGTSTITSEFTIGGLEQAIQPLREACHW